jgi:hypothetical protein
MVDPYTTIIVYEVMQKAAIIYFAYKFNNDPCDECDMAKLEDFYNDETEFSALLDEAERESNNAAEDNFVDDMTNKFEKYGLQMYITQKQINWLQKIAKCKG